MNTSLSNSQQEQAQELIDAFGLFDSWEDRYRFLIDMGRSLPPLPATARVEENRVHGCQSNVWMIPNPTGDGKLDFLADSDSTIVKGLIAVLRQVYAHQGPRDVLDFDINGFLQKLELDQHLSLGRRNGLEGMVVKIKQLATQMES